MDNISKQIRDASIADRNATSIEDTVWNALSEAMRDQLGRTRLRQLIASELTDPSQLEIAFDGERFPVGEIPPDVLERKGNDLIARADGLRRRGEAYLAEAKRLREA